MIYSEPRTTIYRVRIRKRRVAGLLVVLAAITAALGHQGLESPTPTAPSTTPGEAVLDGGTLTQEPGALGQAGGDVPDGATVFDAGIPGVANLDPALAGALRRATTDAGREGVKLVVDSGWRSPEYQAQLLQQAVSQYGSEAEAARWVAAPDRSAHVSGDAVDIGPTDAARWVSENGAQYGLCRVYGNEPWHFELRPDAVDRGCPAVYADPTQDPRMQQ